MKFEINFGKILITLNKILREYGKDLKTRCGKIWEIRGIYFQERILDIFTKIENILRNILKNLEETWSILKKFTENFGRNFKLRRIFEIMLRHFDEILNQF